MPDWDTVKGVTITDATPTGAGGGYLNDNFTVLRDEAPFNATGDPGSGDDSGDGFFVGSQWFNTTSQVMWSCVDASSGAAVWKTLYKRTSTGLQLVPSADGTVQIASQLVSSLSSGTAPLAVTSTTVNTNLNADLLDGNHGSAFGLVAATYYNKDKIVFISAGTLAVASNITNLMVMEYGGTILAARAIVKTAPTGAAIIVDMKKNGTTIQTGTKLQIAASATTGTSSTFSTTTFSAGDYFSLDITQVGSTVAGADLTIVLTIQYT